MLGYADVQRYLPHNRIWVSDTDSETLLPFHHFGAHIWLIQVRKRCKGPTELDRSWIKWHRPQATESFPGRGTIAQGACNPCSTIRTAGVQLSPQKRAVLAHEGHAWMSKMCTASIIKLNVKLPSITEHKGA